MMSPNLKIQSPDQRTQSPRPLTVPLQVEVEGGADEEAEPLEDLDDEIVMVERVEASAAVLLLLLVAGAVTVT